LSAEDCLNLTRHSAWDLWGAGPYIEDITVTGYNLITNIPDAPGVGPYFNLLAQGENYETGVSCWLLYKLGLVKDTTVFDGFDT